MASMATMSFSISTPRFHPKPLVIPRTNNPWIQRNRFGIGVGGGFRVRRVVGAAPERISEKVEESIKHAEEACSDDPASGECVAAWDEVEELSAAASHARDRKKDSDPLETYCKDNPEVDECRTFED